MTTLNDWGPPVERLLLASVGALLAVCAAVWLGVTVFYAQDALLAVISVQVTDGVLAIVWIAAAAALGDLILRSQRWGVNRALAIATCAGVGLGVFSLAALGLGLVGALNRVVAILLPLLSAIAWVVVNGKRFSQVHVDGNVIKDWLSKPAGWHWLWLAAMPALAIATTGACIMPGILWKPDDPHPYDVTSYHLEVPREWLEIGKIVPLTHNMFSYFPFNVEMQFLLSMHARGGAWTAMYMAQFLCVGFAVLAVLAVYGAARVVTGRAGATFAAVAVATTPWMTMFAPVCYVEGALVFYTALAVGWALHGVAGDEQRWRLGAFVISGVCAGLACGVKLTAGPMLLAAVPVGLVLAIRSPRQLASAIAASAVFVAVGLIVFSPWLVRNYFWAGNPFFPNATSLFGSAHWSAGQVERYLAAHSVDANPGTRIKMFFVQIVGQWQWGYVLVPGAIGVATSVLVRSRPAALRLLLGVAAVQVIFWTGFTHLIGRFFVPAIAPLAVIVSLVSRRSLVGGTVFVVLAAGLCLFNLNDRMQRFAASGRVGLFGLEDVSLLQPLELQDIYNNGGTVHFVGDAQVFLHRAKAAQLPYRTVFDIVADTNDPITAWTGHPLSELPEGHWVLVDPAEIHRLSTTYKHVPDVPATYPGPRDQPYLINRHGQVIVPVRQ